MCVSMGLMSEPCCANLDCETQPFILQSGFAHRRHPSGANRLRQAGSYHTGWTCPPARETAAEIVYKLSPCKPLRLRYARGLTAHKLDCPRQAKKHPQCDASADVACKPSPCKPLRLRHAGRLAAAPTSTRNRRLQRDAERAACNATQCAPIASTLLLRPSGARVSRICVLLRLIQSVCDQLLHIAGVFWCGCSRLFRFRIFCFQRWDSDCGRRVRGVVAITAGIA